MNMKINGGLKLLNFTKSNMNNSIKWLSTPEEKILSWRAFRIALPTLSLKNSINMIATTWKNCPLVHKPLFPVDDRSQWPDPWSLISQTVYCNASQTLGIFYTLVLSDLVIEDITMEVCETALGEIQSRVKINKYYIDLNAENIVSTKPDSSLTLMSSYPNPKK